jgi:DNA helicase IV
VSSAEVEREIAYEQGKLAEQYAALDRARLRATTELDRVHRGPTTGTDQAGTERESFARNHVARVQQLSNVERGLTFGRLDQVDDGSFYIGRLGLFDDDHNPLLVDWRAPVARPFYRATTLDPMGIRRRRHLRLTRRAVTGIDDDLLELRDGESGAEPGGPGAVIGEGALFAAMSADRTGRMSEIVATIQAEQDAIIRSDLSGVLVVQGGPGTGKTVVALHRAAYLLYGHRELLARRGVLVVGPNPTFLRYIEQVLPSLGETDVVLSTVESLLPGVVGSAPEAAEPSELKGRLEMAGVIARAATMLRRRPGGRDLTPERLLSTLWSSPDLLAATAPELSATERAALRRHQDAPWSRADVALLDEAAELLGESRAEKQAQRRSAAEQAGRDAEHLAYTREVVQSGLAAGTLTVDPLDVAPFIALMAERTRHRDPVGSLAERAAADRRWQFGHVIVDEAQELSAMEWRMLMRRCPRRSMTVVGDLAQAGRSAGVRSWAELLDRYAPGRWRMAELTVNYRTPVEIMDVAADVLAAVDPTAHTPRSARSSAEPPWARVVPEDDFVAAVVDAVRAEQSRIGEGRLAVLVPGSRSVALTAALSSVLPGIAGGDDPHLLESATAVLAVGQSKGLEFDAVLIADPTAIIAESARGHADLYVAVTRATRRLGVLAVDVLPSVLDRLGRAPVQS